MMLEKARRVSVSIHRDQRGGFYTPWEHGTADPFAATGLNFSHNPAPLTLRGLHFQREPHGQAKRVYCLRGRIFEVVVDLRRESPDCGSWDAFEFGALSDESLYIPAGYAHGFLTLEPDTLVAYAIAGAYHPEAAAGIRWNDPRLAIRWPAHPRVMSDRDATLPDLVL